MKYSFILIAYNEADNVIACIQSIMAQQNLGDDYEIIVVDDGSKDTTAQLVQDFSQLQPRVKLVSDGKNHGRGYGRYRGVEVSTGEYVIMVDTDIILPTNWLATTLPYLQEYDVAGGIAVPDGDVAYIYRRFGLRPKTVMGSTTITGNNGIYKRQVFSKVNFDPKLREGEDVDFNHHLSQTGYKAICVPGLTVEHQEHKSFPRSMQWLFQSGIGATRQLIRFKEIRLPDIAFALTFVTFLGAIILTIALGFWIAFIVPLLGIFGASLLHLNGKFYLAEKPLPAIGALLTNSLLIGCYYVGRIVGPAVYKK